MQEDLVAAQPAHPQQRIKTWQSFFNRYFNTNSLITAIFFSLPIYLSLTGENFAVKLINSIIFIIALYFLINIKNFFQTFFFIGVFLFWWISLSFKYYGFWYLIPVVVLLIGLIYGTIFWLIGKIITYAKFSIFNFPFSIILWSFFLIFGFDYISPFTFDWLKPEMILATTLFNPTKISLFVIIVVLLFFKKFKKPYIFLALIPLLYEPKTSLPPLKINLITTHIPQELKWQQSHIPKEIESNFKYIENSINKFDVVVLPESAFPIFLNLYPELIQELKTLSKKITIITGALHLKDDKFYNSTYIFENGKMKIIDKHLLVPFGEYIPFPIFQEEINKIFFNGASDYATSPSFNTFKIKNINFINAICYEATNKDLYKLTPKYVIALSNLAWFNKLAYIEQKMLIKHYAKEHKKAVFHSINGYKSYIIN